mmetsp:Transcript_2164/g.4330  ORF Transcript_2164/g.4330 Transcript_2164/m.4330 type:complete len:115 (+) Transcript_2164:427-771(+)
MTGVIGGGADLLGDEVVPLGGEDGSLILPDRGGARDQEIVTGIVTETEGTGTATGTATGIATGIVNEDPGEMMIMRDERKKEKRRSERGKKKRRENRRKKMRGIKPRLRHRWKK